MDGEILIAKKSDYSGIKKIWQERFTTDKIYLNIVFKKILPHSISFIYKENNKILSTISLFRVNYYNKTVEKKIDYPLLQGMYLFGVATLKIAEGRRLAALLIEKSIKYLCSKNLDFIIEHPANQSLNKYYFNLNFNISIPKIEYKIPNTIVQLSKSPIICSPLLLDNIRNSFTSWFEWDTTQLLDALIELGEIESHILNENINTNPTFLALNLLNNKKLLLTTKITNNDFSSLFNNTFFCLPME